MIINNNTVSLYSAIKSEDTEALEQQITHNIESFKRIYYFSLIIGTVPISLLHWIFVLLVAATSALQTLQKKLRRLHRLKNGSTSSLTDLFFKQIRSD